MGFQTIKISKFFGVAFPHNPLMARSFSCLRDSSVIENCPDYTYSKGWTVCVSTRYNNIVSWRSVQAFTNDPLPIQIRHEYFIQLVKY